ncbi:hypothetical protein KO02_12275 [Sphingobacterium sp. ML3W]|uniref:hypothetical protein n=1 Tax=Sphingobacterium sp. ML3W TaxID=1538644 RepID=UPI0004F6FF9F|nr:hypothetical protein [Sphingobacterium sp. ML3W]AIM37381.1 hypothetical protein KO02_12275 [Sphingobacterium sp. ML3W]
MDGGVSNDFMQAVVNGTVGVYNEQQAAASEEGDGAERNEAAVGNSEETKQAATTEVVNAAVTEENITKESTHTAAGTEASVTASLDEGQFIATISGGKFSNKEELTAFISKGDQFTSLESRVAELQTENKSLIDNQPKFANDYVSKLNNLIASGASESQIGAFNMLNKSGDLKSLDPLEIRKMALVLQNGITAEDAEIYLRSKYSLDEDLHDAVAVQQSKVTLKIDSVADLNYLEQHLATLSETPAFEKPKTAEQQHADAQAQQSAYLKTSTPYLKQVVDGFGGIKGVSINGKSGTDALTIDMPISDTTKGQLNQVVQNFAVNNQIDVNSAEGKQAIEGFMSNVVKMMEYENNIIHAYNSGQKSMAEKYHNPSNIERTADKEVKDANDMSKAMAFVVNNS